MVNNNDEKMTKNDKQIISLMIDDKCLAQIKLMLQITAKKPIADAVQQTDGVDTESVDELTITKTLNKDLEAKVKTLEDENKKVNFGLEDMRERCKMLCEHYEGKIKLLEDENGSIKKLNNALLKGGNKYDLFLTFLHGPSFNVQFKVFMLYIGASLFYSLIFFPANNYLLRVANTRLLKAKLDGIVLVSLLLILNQFHNFLQCFYY